MNVTPEGDVQLLLAYAEDSLANAPGSSLLAHIEAANTHTYTLLSFCLSLSHTHTHTHTNPLSLSHTHTHTLSLTHTHTHSLSLSHTHAQTYEHKQERRQSIKLCCEVIPEVFVWPCVVHVHRGGCASMCLCVCVFIDLCFCCLCLDEVLLIVTGPGSG